MVNIQQSIKQHHQWLLAILIGFSGVRLVYDFASSDPLILVLVYGCGFLVAGNMTGHRWSLWGMLLYLIVPFAMPNLAMIALAMLIVGLFYGAMPQRVSLIASGLVAFVVLYMTLSPGMLGADAGEFQVVAATWSIAHPPGYPLYTVIAGLMVELLPIETAAWRVNFVSALIGAVTVLLTAYIVQRETKQPFAGLLAGLALLVASTFWLTSTQASIRPLTTFFVAAMLEATLAYRFARKNQQDGRLMLARFGLAAGLGVSHHGSILFIGLVFALSIVLVDIRNWRQLWIAPVVALLGLLPLIYLPIREGAFLSPGYLRTVDGIWYHITGKGFANDMFASAAPAFWPARWQVTVEIFRLQWHGWMLLVGAVGAVIALWRDRWLGFTLIAALITHTFVAVTYRSPQTAEYAIPSYFMIIVMVGWCVGQCASQLLPRQIAAVIVLFSIGLSFQSGWITMRRLSSVEEARIEAESVLNSASSIVLSNWHRVTPLWYLQQVEGVRKDVGIVYVQGGYADSAMGEWAFAIEDRLNLHEGVVVTQLYPESYRFLPFTFENERITTLPRSIPETASSIDIDGYQLFDDRVVLPESVQSGDVLPVTVMWGTDHPVSFGELTTFIHLGALDQSPLAQLDLPMQISDRGAVEIDYDVFVPITVPPGKWHVMAGAYTPDGPLMTNNGDVRISIGDVRIHPAHFPAPTRHPLSIDMGAARLLGWDYDTTLADAPMLYLHWSLDAENQDYMINVVDADNQLLSSITASTGEKTGYWTSMHRLPGDAIDGLQIILGDAVLRLPKLPINDHYVLFDNLAALVDWDVSQQNDILYVNTDWLAAGAAFKEINLSIGIGGQLTEISPPITSSIPMLKWSYGHVVHSEQHFRLESNDPVGEAFVLLIDAFSNRSLFISDTRFGMGVPITP